MASRSLRGIYHMWPSDRSGEGGLVRFVPCVALLGLTFSGALGCVANLSTLFVCRHGSSVASVSGVMVVK